MLGAYSPAIRRRPSPSACPRSPGCSTVLKKIFTWWNGATPGALLTIKRLGAFVGEDDFGNRYFEAKTDEGKLRRP